MTARSYAFASSPEFLRTLVDPWRSSMASGRRIDASLQSLYFLHMLLWGAR